LLEEHPETRAVITCRIAVYKGEFGDTVDRTFETIDFSDQQIRRFLRSWAPGMPKDKSVDQLMQTLRDRPQMMALARNPLLLTIIAYLYTDTAYVLPQSRAEFYHQSTDVLLRQLKMERNIYDARDKRLVLQRLALYNQDSSLQSQEEDRRSMDYQTVLDQVANELPGLSLSPEDSRPLLLEIVERSGLLLSIDGGTKYQFAHQTLQEFFAAADLLDDPDGLLNRFKADPDAWRETVKLWTGLTRDGTAVVREIYRVDPITAFECLADAQQIHPGLAQEIIDSFKAKLGSTDAQPAILQAFAFVGSDRKPRGQAIFKFLKESLTGSDDTYRRSAAAVALSLTNLPEAAEVLAAYLGERSEVRAPLIRMGDVAIPALVALAQKGSIDALDDLQAIGTPQAAESLVPLLWAVDERLSTATAWRMAAMLQIMDVEEGLRAYRIEQVPKHRERLDWVWQPFGEDANSGLPMIAGRIAYLLNEGADLAPESTKALEPRLIIPLCSVLVETKRKFLGLEKARLFGVGADEVPAEEMSNRIEDAFQFLDYPKHRQRFFACIPPRLALDLLRRLASGRIPKINDWLNVTSRSTYDFEESVEFRLTLAITLFSSAFALYQITVTILRSPAILSARTAIAFAATFAICWTWFLIWRGEASPGGNERPESLYMALLGPIIGLVLVLIAVYEGVAFVIHGAMSKSSLVDWNFVADVFKVSPAFGWPPAVGYFGTWFLLRFFSLTSVVLVWSGFVGICGILALVGWWRARAAANPLRGILSFTEAGRVRVS
jgi:hypothetical protein